MIDREEMVKIDREERIKLERERDISAGYLFLAGTGDLPLETLLAAHGGDDIGVMARLIPTLQRQGPQGVVTQQEWSRWLHGMPLEYSTELVRHIVIAHGWWVDGGALSVPVCSRHGTGELSEEENSVAMEIMGLVAAEDGWVEVSALASAHGWDTAGVLIRSLVLIITIYGRWCSH